MKKRPRSFWNLVFLLTYLIWLVLGLPVALLLGVWLYGDWMVGIAILVMCSIGIFAGHLIWIFLIPGVIDE